MSYPVPDGACLLRVVGAGTFCQVALVLQDGRRCACKRLRSRMLGEPAARVALEREARVLALARHDALPELVRSGADERGPFLIESWAEGTSLLALGRAQASSRALAGPALAGLMAAAARALADLHALAGEAGPLGLVHGDIAPDHVLWDGARVRFIDLGLARWRGLDTTALVGERGTLPYVAPELIRGEQPPDQETDVFALAASLAFVALGREPCRARTPAARLVEVAERGLDLAAVAACGRLPPGPRAALIRALAPDPAGRLPGAAELAAALAS
ncbi:MAG: phosphotransferase [Deltaproteobacteria bacterium]|nr:phosphotransferase [Deltaproteobacteria bacterium]